MKKDCSTCLYTFGSIESCKTCIVVNAGYNTEHKNWTDKKIKDYALIEQYKWRFKR